MNNKLLSIIFLSYYSKDRILVAYNKIKNLLDSEKIPFEFIVMDDGSKDDSYKIALELEKEFTNVFAYQLSKNYTSHYSAFGGLSKCNGACAMLMVDDEQQPYSTIVDMYRLWEQGHKIIIPYRIKREDPFISKMFSLAYYKIMNAISEITFPTGGADLYFIDREIIDILNNDIHHINTSSIVEILRIGFDPYYYSYERPLGLNDKKSRWSFGKKLKLAMDTFYSTSAFPIKFITFAGIIFSLLSFMIILFYFYIRIFGNSQFWGISVPGWTSIILFISFFSGLILLSLGIIAGYIWRIYEEVKARPGFIIKKK